MRSHASIHHIAGKRFAIVYIRGVMSRSVGVISVFCLHSLLWQVLFLWTLSSFWARCVVALVGLLSLWGEERSPWELHTKFGKGYQIVWMRCAWEWYLHVLVVSVWDLLCYWLTTPFSSYTHTTGMIHLKVSVTCWVWGQGAPLVGLNFTEDLKLVDVKSPLLGVLVWVERNILK